MTTPLVVFDLDGTLTPSDTSLPFLSAVATRVTVGLALAEIAAFLPLDLLGAMRAEQAPPERTVGGVGGRLEGLAHERLCRRILRGRTRQSLTVAAREFADRQVDVGLRVDTLQSLVAHRDAGHRIWIVSASLELYVEPIAVALGIEGALGTALQWEGDVATGDFAGLPCWGREKLRRLRAAVGEEVAIHRAYGNGAGDAALLATACEGIWVPRQVARTAEGRR